MENAVRRPLVQIQGSKITCASCDCKIGTTGRCRHVAVLLLQVAFSISKTDLPCEWSRKNPPSNTETRTVAELFPSKQEKSKLEAKFRIDASEIREKFLELSRKENLKTPAVWIVEAEPPPAEVPFCQYDLQKIVSLSEFKHAEDKKSYLNKSLNLNDSIIQSIAETTIGQWENDTYIALHKFRITASNFGSVIAAIGRNRYPPSLFQKLRASYNLEKVQSVKYGKCNEKNALMAFKEYYKSINGDEEIRPAGLYIHPNGVIAASPDAISNQFVVEIKCPFKFRKVGLTKETLHAKEKYVITILQDDSVEINKNHEYYSQIQGQIHLCNKLYGYLVIWTPVNYVVIRIDRDENWAKNILALENFFYNVYLPFLETNTS